MCDFCSIAKSSAGYISLLDQMFENDRILLEKTKKTAENMQILKDLCYTSVKWPVNMHYPLFEARNAFAVPTNYFQNLFINGGKTSVYFSENSTRSIFFTNTKRLMVYSKHVSRKEGEEFFTSFLLCHFEPEEYEYSFEGDTLTLRANTEKKMRNLITEETETKKISFNFIHKKIGKRILTKEQAATSTQLKLIYEKYAGVSAKLASADMEGYVITVPHFSPHPYMLRHHSEFGYDSNREFQEHVMDYFFSHLNL
ncbi:hypothetical protein JXB01_03130 [Candidatus Micrarchaeota archaeon]|nr:hypothetical protein [Candidatus Micrarchaeota archaeon]